MPGPFIVFEGPEGSGKSTQARWLFERLEQTGHRVVLTREPGGTETGERIRAILLELADVEMLPETEALLYSAARAEHVARVVQPELAAGSVVICDRFTDSTLAYQGGGRGLPIASLTSLQVFATRGLEPDLRLLLDLPVEIGLQRRYRSGEEVNRLDAAGLAFHERVRHAYLQLANATPDAWVVLDATASPEEVRAAVEAAVLTRFPRLCAKFAAS